MNIFTKLQVKIEKGEIVLLGDEQRNLLKISRNLTPLW